jgi:HSP20 family molecular chaperone IbpA
MTNYMILADLEAEQINATYKDGVLAVLLPKSEDAKPHKVEVKIA